MLICPICETENKPQASHCEVCGERLKPPAPGEVLSPEESVASLLSTGGGGGPGQPAPGPVMAQPAPAPPAVPPRPAPAPMAPPTPVAPAAPVAPVAPVAPAAPITGGGNGFFLDDAPAAPSTPAPAPAPVAAAPPTPPTPAPAPAPARPAPAPAPVAPPRIQSSGIPNARLVVYQNKQPAHTHPVVNDETLIGRYDPIGGSYPDLDMTEFDPECATSRKHFYIYRMNREFYLYPVSNAGTQLNNTMVDMGQKKALAEGDVIILAGKIAVKFHRDP